MCVGVGVCVCAHLDGLNTENTFHCWLCSSLYNCVCDKKTISIVFFNLRWPNDSAYIYIYIYIIGGPLSALTCCVNVRLLSGDKKNIAVNLFSKLGWELGLYYASYDDFHPDILARMYT